MALMMIRIQYHHVLPPIPLFEMARGVSSSWIVTTSLSRSSTNSSSTPSNLTARGTCESGIIVSSSSTSLNDVRVTLPIEPSSLETSLYSEVVLVVVSATVFVVLADSEVLELAPVLFESSLVVLVAAVLVDSEADVLADSDVLTLADSLSLAETLALNDSDSDSDVLLLSLSDARSEALSEALMLMLSDKLTLTLSDKLALSD